MNRIAIIGAGGHTRSAINILKANYKNYLIEIFDDTFEQDADERICGLKVVGKIEDILPNTPIFLAIGDNEKRGKFAEMYESVLIKENICHNKSFIEENVSLGESNQIFANTYINSGAKIGNNNIVNTNAIIEHEVVIGSNNHISVGSIVCGRVTIGDSCMLGAGAVIIDKVSICDKVIIGAGAVVVSDITESGTYIGTPARKVK